MHLIIYGDFNCPFSAVASRRAAQLEAAGLARIDWRAVVHDPSVPTAARPVTAEQRDAFRDELDQISELLNDADDVELHVPPIQVDTTAAVQAFAAAPAGARSVLRGALFDAYWVRGEDLSDVRLLAHLGATGRDAALADRWREEWQGLDRPIVPEMVLPDGQVSRGLGVLRRLAEQRDAARSG